MRRIRTDDLAWSKSVKGVRSKTAFQNGRQVRLVEFAAGFCEADWCSKGHIGYVLAGRLEVIFADGTDLFSPGDILMISAGDADKHRARVVEGPVRLFLVEEA